VSFFAICDTFTDHPKAVKAGNAALGAWARMGSYSAHHLTDGVIPRAVCRRIASKSQIDRLTTAGLLEVQPDGDFMMHDYLDYNPSKAQVVARKDAKSKAGAKGAEMRWGKSPPIAPAMAPASSTSHGNSIALPSPPLPSPPVSTPAASQPSDARRVFDFWVKDTGKAKAKFVAKRRTRIEARLREGYTVDELCAAITHRRNDLNLMGQNDRGTVYDGISTLLRDGEQVERLRDLTEPGRPRGGNGQLNLGRSTRAGDLVEGQIERAKRLRREEDEEAARR
jgi:hypothetical protein